MPILLAVCRSSPSPRKGPQLSNLGFLRFAAPLVALACLITPGPALANHVQCGDLVTTSVKLDSDVVCPDPGGDSVITGLIIGADNIVVDLNGYAIRASGYSENDDVNGIVGDGTPHSNVRIRNGSITGFSQAINFGFRARSPLTDSVIRNVTAAGSIAVYLRGDRNIVRDSTLRGSFDALRLRGADNVASGNTLRSVEGPALEMSGDRPTAIGNVASVPDYGYQSAIQIVEFTDAVVRSNTAFHVSQTAAILLFDGIGGHVVKNTATESRSGIRVTAVTGVLVEKNQASGNVLGDPESPSPDDGTGIYVDAGNTVRKNTANDNLLYGIYAEPGAVDGGGNRARGNGVADCVGVRCK
jgi:hypothetical protein